MAQLTDDCFAFSGPLLPVSDLERIIGERVDPVAETEIVPLSKCAWPHLGKGHYGADQSATVR